MQIARLKYSILKVFGVRIFYKKAEKPISGL